MTPKLYAAGLSIICAFVAFTALKAAFRGVAPAGEIDRWRNLAMVLLGTAFLISNYWIALSIAVVALLVIGVNTRHPIALFVVALMIYPPYPKIIPGFGSINVILTMSPTLAFVACFLIPLWFAGRDISRARMGLRMTDLLATIFFCLGVMLSYRDVSFTAGTRLSIEFLARTAPIYFVFSRYQWTPERLNALAAAFVGALATFTLIAGHEFVTGWHHFYEAAWSWNLPVMPRNFDRAGMTRIEGPFLGSIEFGVFLSVAIAFALVLYAQSRSRMMPRAAIGALLVGLIVSFSRGPWLQSVAMLVVKSLIGPKGVGGAIGVIAGLGAIVIALSATPIGSAAISQIPGIGDEGADSSFDYRRMLLEVGSEQVMENPLLGSSNYGDAPRMQVLVQGQGIIDYVNTYLHIALDYGLIGLGLYVGVLLTALSAGLRSTRVARNIDPAFDQHARTIFATLVGFAVLVASMTIRRAQLTELNWMLIALAIGVARAIAARKAAPSAAPVEEAPGEERRFGKPAPEVRPDREAQAAMRDTPAHLRQYVKSGE